MNSTALECTVLQSPKMGEGVVSGARLRLLRTINYTGLQIVAIAFLNPVMIGT